MSKFLNSWEVGLQLVNVPNRFFGNNFQNFQSYYFSEHIRIIVYGSTDEPSPALQDLLNPFQLRVTFHIETSHLICTSNQITGFCMKCNTGPHIHIAVSHDSLPKSIDWFLYEGNLSVTFHIETSHFIYSPNQINGL